MLLRRLIYRDPNADGGGGVTTSSTSASSAPAGGTPPASTGAGSSDPFQSFAESLAKVSSRDSVASQPPGDGNQADPQASGDEGDELDNTKAEDTDTTTELDGDTDGKDGKGVENKWSSQEQELLKAKGLDIPFSPDASKFLKSYEELQAQFGRVSSSNTNAITRNQELESALMAGDAKALQAMGYDLKLDQRTPDQMISEISDQFDGIKNAFTPILQKLADIPEAHGPVFNAVKSILNSLEQKATIIEQERKDQERESAWAKKYGLAKNTPNTYQEMSSKAQTNLTELAQSDPKATEYFQLLEPLTKPGGALHAMGISLAKAYGTSPETAKAMNEIAKGMYFAKNQKEILNGERKKWERDEAKKGHTRMVNGHSPANNPNNRSTDSVSHIQAGMRAFMGQPA